MDPAALKLIFQHLKKLKTDMRTGQDKMENTRRPRELKKDMIRIGTGQEETKNYIQDKMSANISAIRSGQAEFEKKITDKLHKQL
jgi:hypothetical protein